MADTITSSAAHTAMCLWEEYCTNVEDPLWEPHREAYGTNALREQILSWASDCDGDWFTLEKEFDSLYDFTFDWEYCPTWLRGCVAWDSSHPHPKPTDERLKYLRVVVTMRG